MSNETPMMRQYKSAKKRYPDSILFFRLGDFYEMFFEDAKLASKVLGIALTSRNKSDKNPVPLCGVPFHSAEPYLAKLLERGHKVAICEQVEDPRYAKGVVERRVTRVLTPGTILDSENLESRSNNYIASVYCNSGSYALAYADISTGEFKTTMLSSIDDLKSEISSIEPKEILLQEDANDSVALKPLFQSGWNPLITSIENWMWDHGRSKEILKEFLSVPSLDGFGLETRKESVVACGVLLNYLKETQMDFMPPLSEPVYFENTDYLLIDESTKRNLEITKTIRGDTGYGSLISVLDETLTPMGGRLLKQWLNYPLISLDEIGNRHDSVEELIKNVGKRRELNFLLKEISDIERLIGRICTTAAKPRDLGALRDSSPYISKIKELIGGFKSPLLSDFALDIDDYADVYELLVRSLVDSPPGTTRDGGIIGDGYSKELDELRGIRRDGKRWISELERKERESTGINSLKVGFNKVFGYYIEVTKTNIDQVPERYTRKQTLANGERYITSELKEYEEKILTAESRILEMESKLFEEIRCLVANNSERIRKTSQLIAVLDVLNSLAEISDKYGYVRPEVDESFDLEIKDGRHPVVERMDLEAGFVSNNITMDGGENRFLVITGPNMAGKSTVIRQAALTVLMAQMGCFVPASKAKIGIVDRIFTRVGASDNLSMGQSTFMVEMVETAYILRYATERSIVILDEIGRGTSTFDGMSIAWAVAEYLNDVGCRTLFATHYHELSQLALMADGMKNYNVLVKEEGDSIVFLRKLVPGASSNSYGIEVAKIAGVPERIIKSAKNILYNLEKNQSKIGDIDQEQIPLFSQTEEDKKSDPESEILDELKDIDPNSLTPIEALNVLFDLKNKMKG